MNDKENDKVNDKIKEKSKKIKLIIAEDNKEFNNILKQILESNDEIEVIGSCYSDEQELQMIEKLHPEIVITDLVRNGKKTGLEIIRKCKEKSNIPKFLVITAGGDDEIDYDNIDGLIKKPIINYEIIVDQLLILKKQIMQETLRISNDNDTMVHVGNIFNDFSKKFGNNKKRKFEKIIKNL